MPIVDSYSCYATRKPPKTVWWKSLFFVLGRLVRYRHPYSFFFMRNYDPCPCSATRTPSRTGWLAMSLHQFRPPQKKKGQRHIPTPFPMDLQAFPYGFSSVSLWMYKPFPTNSQACPYGFTSLSLWICKPFPMNFPAFPCRFPNLSLWTYKPSPVALQALPYGFIISFPIQSENAIAH